MKLIVGLGNPGHKYQNNRHNVGFILVDYLKQKLGQITNDLFKERKMLHVTCYMLHDYILAKPQTFMNLSGTVVQACVTSYKLQVTSDLIIAHDDLDLPLGKYKIQKGVGPKLHNGILSIEQALKTKDFWRVRIGVDNRQPDNKIFGESYVLQDFTEEEKKAVDENFPKIFSALNRYMRI